MTNELLLEARRLHGLGFALLPLHPKSKRPKGLRWTEGPRTTWEQFQKAYKPGDNIGVRTGEASKIGKYYLACIDVDVHEPSFKAKANKILKGILGDTKCPEVLSGSGTGSRHLYCLTERPFKQITLIKEKNVGEICVYSSGRQMVLAGSIHPDTGKPYKWIRSPKYAADLPVIHFEIPEENEHTNGNGNGHSKIKGPFSFKTTVVEVEWLPISEKILAGILHGVGVEDRSAFLLMASNALVNCGLDKDEVLSVLTNPNYFISQCMESRRGKNRLSQAQWLWEYTVKKVFESKTFKGIFKTIEPERELTAEEIKEQTKEFSEIWDWRQELTKNDKNKPIGTVVNVTLILENALSKKLVRRNLFAFRDTYGAKAPWGGTIDDVLSDDDDVQIKYWLGQHFGLEPKKEAIRDALTIIACRNAYDPVKDYITKLPKWDEKPRIGTWLAKNFEAEGHPDYLAQVFRKWLVAMIMRAFQPGSRFPWMPIFEGAQGVGKSSFGRILVGDTYFLDWLPNLADKDSALGLQGMWCVEMGELATLKKNELEVVKGYVVRNTDKIRPPFARRWIESHRRCVFFGTTNKSKYLIDETGNRRFKPVKVGNLDFESLIKERDLLFSEARFLFEKGIESEKSLSELTGKAKAFENEIHTEKMIEDDSSVMAELVLDFFEKVEEGTYVFDLEKFKLTSLFQSAPSLSRWHLNKRNEMFLAKALFKIGCRKKEIMGRNYWNYEKAAPEVSFL